MSEYVPEYIDRLKLVPDRCDYDELGAVSVDQIFHEEVADVVEREKYDLLKLAYDTLRHALAADRTIVIPEGATFGDAIMAMFPNVECREDRLGNVFVVSDAQLGYIVFRECWWNAPYKIESEEK